ncbi:SCP-like protein [Ancylostoma duodenale]|uniref:SCP-like protein n=1 Tax=Ancylostoma duodenale TaxID=51022 RepID=A0A0C2H3S7_9BILA|nr:SCP-like protein [Ancylostoma duodenale]
MAIDRLLLRLSLTRHDKLDSPLWTRIIAAFNCKGKTLNDDVREVALNYHNNIRTRINQDQVEDKNKQKLPKAENMYKMIYDCALEEEAAKLVDQCAETYMKSQMHGINFKHFGQGSDPTQLASPLTQILQTWSEQIVTKEWFVDNRYKTDPDMFEFSNMVLAKTTAVGCSEAMCGGTKASAACVFNQPDVEDNQELYVSGTPCTMNDECKTYPPSTCEASESLCIKGEPTTSTTSQATTSSSETTTSSSEATTSSSEATTSSSEATTSSSEATTSSSEATTSPPDATTSSSEATTSANPASSSTTQVTTTNAHKDPSINQICPTNSGVNDKIRNKTLEMHNFRSRSHYFRLGLG